MSDNPYKPKLVFVGEHFAGRVYELTQEKTTVGRSDRNLLIVHDPSVSHAHCEILVNGPEVIVIDLSSANGTYVNGTRLQHQQAQLKPDSSFGLEPSRPAWSWPLSPRSTRPRTAPPFTPTDGRCAINDVNGVPPRL